MKEKKRVAIISDTVSGGGAEKVLMVFLSMFPESDLYTLYIFPDTVKKIKKQFPEIKIKTSIFQLLISGKKISKYISVIKLVSWIYWEILNLKGYDLIISSSHSYMAKNVKKGKRGLHLSYIHTPPRFLYDEYCEIEIAKKLPLGWLRWIDKNGSKRPDIIVVNSENVKARVKKYYNRDAVVIYPPVENNFKNNPIKKKEYYICLSRLVKQKGIGLAVDTCTKYNLPLYVVGDGDEYLKLKKRAGKSIKFIRKCNDIRKMKLLSQAKALIYTSIDEDFGIVPIEAMSVKTPVIAFYSGGVKESVLKNKTGVFFKSFDTNSLKKAIDKLDKLRLNWRLYEAKSNMYNLDTFKEKIINLINVDNIKVVNDKN